MKPTKKSSTSSKTATTKPTSSAAASGTNKGISSNGGKLLPHTLPYPLKPIHSSHLSHTLINTRSNKRKLKRACLIRVTMCSFVTAAR